MRISDWSSDVCSSDLSTLGRHLFAFVWLPRDDLSTRRRVAIGEMLSEAANAALLSWSIAMEDGVVALLRYTLDMRADGRIPVSDAPDARTPKMVSGWVPAVEAALVRHIRLGERRGGKGCAQ